MKKKLKHKIIHQRPKGENGSPKATDVIPQYYSTFGVQTYHNAGNFGAGTSVYVIDSGFNGTKDKDLQNVIVEQFANSPGSPEQHGGYTAEMVAAPSNDFGIIGIAPGATVYLGDVDDAGGNISTDSMIQAINSAISHNVDIINISLGSFEQDPNLSAAIKRAYDAGILIFVAAGNESTTQCEYPACDVGAIAVGSVNNNHVVSDFSNRGSYVVLYAPGEDYPLPNQDGGFSYVSGTSFSSPFAAGLAALVLSDYRKTSNNPSAKMSRDQMIAVLQDADHLNQAAVVFPPTTSSSWWIILLVILGILVIAGIIIAIFMNQRSKSPKPYPPQPPITISSA